MLHRPSLARRGRVRAAALLRRLTGRPGICGACMIRDSVDLVPLLCGHYLRIGFDRLIFVDDNSTDGTFEALRAIAQADPRVSVRRSADPVLRQAQVMNCIANAAIAGGDGIVFPFDADEFWDVDADRIRAAATRPGLLVGRWVQFVQDRGVEDGGRDALLLARHRAPDLGDAGPDTIMRYERSFVCFTTTKVGFRAKDPVDILTGQHGLANGPLDVLADDMEVFHLPLRSLSALRLRAMQAARILAHAQPGEHWQSRFFRDAMAEGRLGVAWAANSASPDGFLDLPGARIPLIPDTRLQALLSDAMAYMTRHHAAALAAMPAVSVPR